MLDNLQKKIKKLDAYKKRGIIYLGVSALFIGYELLFHHPPRLIVILLWLGVIVIAISIIVTLKEPDH